MAMQASVHDDVRVPVTTAGMTSTTPRGTRPVGRTTSVFDVGLDEHIEHVDIAAELERLLELLNSHDFTQAWEPAEAILANGDGPGAELAVACALTVLAWLAWNDGRVAAALGLMRAAIQRGDRSPLTPRELRPRLCVAPMLVALGLHDEATRCIAAGRREIARSGDRTWAMLPTAANARLLSWQGQLEDAEHQARDALRAIDDAPLFVAPLVLARLAEIALLRNDVDTVSDCLRRHHELLAAPSVIVGPATFPWIAGQLAARNGERQRAIDLLAPIYDDLGAHRRLFLEHPGSAAWLVRAARHAGDESRARAVVVAADQLATDNREFPAVAAAAAHARGLLDGDMAALRSSVGHWHAWARASAHEDIGRVLRSCATSDAGRDAFGDALAGYRIAGAVADAHRVAERLVQHPAPAAMPEEPRPVEGWDSLTETEQRVVGLVAQGLTNREVAERAYLSRHTVDFHLRQVFRKLQVSSRVKLTRLFVEHTAAA
jgi:DNA-binding CsgD family transcriptional regulator